MNKSGQGGIADTLTTMAQFSCKLACTPLLWNPRASRLEGKSKEAVKSNKDIDLLLLSIQKALTNVWKREWISRIRCQKRSMEKSNGIASHHAPFL